MPTAIDIELTPPHAASSASESTLFTVAEDEADFVLFAPQIQVKLLPQPSSQAKQPKTLAEWLFSF